ncbi:hypothetical protein BT69DRAFT_1338715 [Atractiella rhizophila]|nr:hypothetical protein BT69DRAFT_1338715 [Atractiella rhizophila]
MDNVTPASFLPPPHTSPLPSAEMPPAVAPGSPAPRSMSESRLRKPSSQLFSWSRLTGQTSSPTLPQSPNSQRPSVSPQPRPHPMSPQTRPLSMAPPPHPPPTMPPSTTATEQQRDEERRRLSMEKAARQAEQDLEEAIRRSKLDAEAERDYELILHQSKEQFEADEALKRSEAEAEKRYEAILRQSKEQFEAEQASMRREAEAEEAVLMQALQLSAEEMQEYQANSRVQKNRDREREEMELAMALSMQENYARRMATVRRPPQTNGASTSALRITNHDPQPSTSRAQTRRRPSRQPRPASVVGSDIEEGNEPPPPPYSEYEEPSGQQSQLVQSPVDGSSTYQSFAIPTSEPEPQLEEEETPRPVPPQPLTEIPTAFGPPEEQPTFFTSAPITHRRTTSSYRSAHDLVRQSLDNLQANPPHRPSMPPSTSVGHPHPSTIATSKGEGSEADEDVNSFSIRRRPPAATQTPDLPTPPRRQPIATMYDRVSPAHAISPVMQRPVMTMYETSPNNIPTALVAEPVQSSSTQMSSLSSLSKRIPPKPPSRKSKPSLGPPPPIPPKHKKPPSRPLPMDPETEQEATIPEASPEIPPKIEHDAEPDPFGDEMEVDRGSLLVHTGSKGKGRESDLDVDASSLGHGDSRSPREQGDIQESSRASSSELLQPVHDADSPRTSLETTRRSRSSLSVTSSSRASLIPDLVVSPSKPTTTLPPIVTSDISPPSRHSLVVLSPADAPVAGEEILRGVRFGYSGKDEGEGQFDGRGSLPSVVPLSFLEKNTDSFCIESRSWSVILRYLMWYGNTRIEPTPHDIAFVESEDPLRVQIHVIFWRTVRGTTRVRIRISLLPVAGLSPPNSQPLQPLPHSPRILQSFYPSSSSSSPLPIHVIIPNTEPLPLNAGELAQKLFMIGRVARLTCSGSSRNHSTNGKVLKELATGMEIVRKENQEPEGDGHEPGLFDRLRKRVKGKEKNKEEPRPLAEQAALITPFDVDAYEEPKDREDNRRISQDWEVVG